MALETSQHYADEFHAALHDKLAARRADNSLRTLVPTAAPVDFSSGDYLGLSTCAPLAERVQQAWMALGVHQSLGSGSSRLIRGTTELTESIERDIASFHGAEAGLLFNSGYDANLGLCSSLFQRGDTVLYDAYIHASMRDGVRLSLARNFSFAHNNVEQLEQKLRKAEGRVWVLVESVYSMDGDTAPLAALAALCQRYGAALIVDEAHATGVYGERGEGLCQALGIHERVFARVHTFGKALGSHGAIVLGSDVLRNYLINFARSFIYTTAAPVHTLLTTREAYRYVAANPDIVQALRERIQFFTACAAAYSHVHVVPSDSAIQCCIIPGNTRVKAVAALVQQQGFDVRPILSPTVPAGAERLRICLHTYNSNSDITALLATLAEALL